MFGVYMYMFGFDTHEQFDTFNLNKRTLFEEHLTNQLETLGPVPSNKNTHKGPDQYIQMASFSMYIRVSSRIIRVSYLYIYTCK